MGKYVSSEVVKLMLRHDLKIRHAKILILGITFKENCPDVRNTKVIDVINNLKSYDAAITVFDPWADSSEVQHEYGLQITNTLPKETFDAVVLTVSHNTFLEMDVRSLLNEHGVLYDVKGILTCPVDGRL